MPNKNSRVCNVHFVDGEPTVENPDPTLQLGHNKKTRASKRPPPSPRDNSLVVRSRKRAKLDTCSHEVPVPVLDHSADNLACDGVTVGTGSAKCGRIIHFQNGGKFLSLGSGGQTAFFCHVHY